MSSYRTHKHLYTSTTGLDIFLDGAPPSGAASKTAVPDSHPTGAAPDAEDPDADCPFRSSSLYRKVYVYPTQNDTSSGWGNATSGIMSPGAGNSSGGVVPPWPWLQWDEDARKGGWGHYDVRGMMGQYTLELIVREIFTHPKSCLRTNDPETASLFYVPYLPSAEFHKGKVYAQDYSTSPYAQALYDAIEGQYGGWEDLFGLTSKYWIRNGGSDHVMVYSEPLHGLSHPRSKRGSHHYIQTQRQLRPPIAVSVEVSTAFVSMYPKCSSKNVVVPYPNPDGRWYNGALDREAEKMTEDLWGLNVTAAHPAERSAATATPTGGSSDPRPLAHFYRAGAHGECAQLRRALQSDLGCSPSSKVISGMLSNKLEVGYSLGMRAATFCPCPGGDSPGAKRNFDAVLAGCIPVVLSKDFVWPFTKEADPVGETRDASDFSLRWNVTNFTETRFDPKTCKQKEGGIGDGGFKAALERVGSDEIERLRRALRDAKDLYSFYEHKVGLEDGVADNPLMEGVLPAGGASRELVRALEKRARGVRWGPCEEELKLPRGNDPRHFQC